MMQKSKKATIVIIILILIYIIYTNFNLVLNYNTLYYYGINPLFWILLCIFLRFTFGKSAKTYKLKRKISQYTITAVLIYIITYSLSGLFLTYGKNPYSRSFTGVLLNIWIFGVEIIAKEYVRYQLIHNVYDKDKPKIAFLISFVYVISDFGLWKIETHNINFLYLLKEFAQTIMPSIARNVLCSYISMNATYYPAIIYNFITEFYFWTSPILPNSPWIMVSIIDTTIPILLCLYIRFIKYKNSIFKSKEDMTNIDPKNIIPLVILIIFSIWFAIGIFPIKPIAIATGSMEKELMIGDIAIIQKMKASDILVGDIIEYRKDDYTVVHRVIEKKQKNGELYFITKGDNNRSADSDPVMAHQVIGKVIFKIRYLGYPAIWLHLIQVEEQYQN